MLITDWLLIQQFRQKQYITDTPKYDRHDDFSVMERNDELHV